MPRIRALRDSQMVTEINEGESLDVECTVDRVHPAENPTFQLMSGGTTVSNREAGSNSSTK